MNSLILNSNLNSSCRERYCRCTAVSNFVEFYDLFLRSFDFERVKIVPFIVVREMVGKNWKNSRKIF